MWMWERPDWPEFRFEEGRLADAMRRFAEADAGLVGRSEGFGDEWRRELAVELMFAEALASHAIEGEALDSESVRSSLLLALGGLSESPRRDPRIAEGGAVALILDARRHWDQPLTKQRLCAWQSMALAGRAKPTLEVGDYRSGPEKMGIVSGNGSLHGFKPMRVHYEAPPSDRVPAEMARFLEWFNASRGRINGLARTAVAHLWFEKIHPFDDGNGRVGRALADLAASQALGRPTLSCLATAINQDRDPYYRALEQAGRDGMDVNPFLDYFAGVALRAQEIALREVRFVLGKARFFSRFDARLNARQRKAALRVFAEGSKGFAGGLSRNNYQAITKASSATATRDLADLVRIGAMTSAGEGRSVRYALATDPPQHLLLEALADGAPAGAAPEAEAHGQPRRRSRSASPGP